MVGKTFADSSALCIRKQSLYAFVANPPLPPPAAVALIRHSHPPENSNMLCSVFDVEQQDLADWSQEYV